MQHSGSGSQIVEFARETDGLSEARTVELIELRDGDEFDLEIRPVKKRIGDATVHWHGLRLENRYDGTHETQAPIPVGETFTYQVHVPDAGAHWYHPHIREDYGQEMGLYGNILVAPSEPDYWPPANRELLLTLDDILIEDGQIAAFRESETTHVAMGRFGNVMLVGGEADLQLAVNRGEVVRFYLTNTANTRVFNVGVPGAQLKLVGADAGHYEHEELVEEVLLAPSERVVVDVLFADAGKFELEHRTPERTYRLASIAVADARPEESYADQFAQLRTNADMVELREHIEPFLQAAPDKTLSFVAEMDMGIPEGVPVVYACPMHPDVVSDEPGSCPKCGMKFLPERVVAAGGGHGPEHHHGHGHGDEHAGHGHGPHGHGHGHDRHGDEGAAAEPEHGHQEHGHHGQEHHGQHGHEPGEHEHAHDTAQGIEWEDDMVEVNRMTTP